MTNYESLSNLLLLYGEDVMAGEDENGEYSIVQRFPKTKDVGEHICVSTGQRNGWVRVLNYYKDGTIDETYER